MVGSPGTTREELWKKWDEGHKEHNRKSPGEKEKKKEISISVTLR